MNQKKRTFITSALIAPAFLLTSAFAGAELPLRTISLSHDEEIKASSYQVAAGKAVRIQNDMDRILHNTSISRLDPDKHMLSVQTFHSMWSSSRPRRNSLPRQWGAHLIQFYQGKYF